MGEYKKMVEALSDLCSDLKKKISELENDLEEKDSKIAKLESELSVESVLKSDNTLSRGTLIGVNVNGINKTYSIEKISEIVRAYEDIQYCKEHAGEHLHSEEHLKIIQLRQKIDCLERNSSKKDELIESLKSKLDESVGGERNLCEEIEKLEQEKRENRDKMFPYESIEDMKERIASFEDRYQSDCIAINQLNVCIDILCEKYSVLREIHGHKEDKLCGY